MPLSYELLSKMCSSLDSELEEVYAENEMYVDTIAMQRRLLVESAQLLSLSKLENKRRELN